ncbi:Dak phosphatase, partial [Micromonospora zhanjiangensis]
MLETLDAAAVNRWCTDGLAALKRHQREIDDLNVYPVPDGDTGTNMVLTLNSADQARTLGLDRSAGADGTGHGHVLRLMARGALL